MRHRLRKHSRRHDEDGDGFAGNGRKLPYGLIWLGLTVLVLVLVLVYDRRSISDGEGHIESGHALVEQGMYLEALEEFESALDNRRLGRKARGNAALAMADIYYEHFEDYPAAHRYYVQARQISSSILNTGEVQARAKRAEERARGTGLFRPRELPAADGVTTRTVIQRVELLSPPQMYQRGPVVARYEGGEIHAGELMRALEKRPEFYRPDFRKSPQALKDFLNGLIKENLAYEAAVMSDIHKDSDLSERLYDYQKSLITQRFLVDRREQALVVDNTEVEKYYAENQAEFVKPGQIAVSMIRTSSQTSATELLQMLRDGASFADVATSYSVDEASAAKGGSVGTFTEGDSQIPGIGEAKAVIDGLFKLKVHSISEVIPLNGNHYIFRVDNVAPAQNITLNEARGRIENVLRGQNVDRARLGLEGDLEETFEPELVEEGLSRFWDFVLEETTRQADINTTRSEGLSTGTLSTTESVAQQ